MKATRPTICTERLRANDPATCGKPVSHRVVGYFVVVVNGSRDLFVCEAHARRHAGFPNFMQVKPLSRKT